jgi:diguanylate cyclase (GGDEF)-like protein
MEISTMAAGEDPQCDFEEVIAEELKNQPLTVVLLEVDDLRHLYQVYGARRGDKVIKGVTEILERTIRKGDVLAHHEVGSFALILRDAGFSEAAAVCERMRASVEASFFAPLQGQVLRATLSAGYATSTDDAPFEQAKDFVRAAQECLSQAKQSGRNQVVGYLTQVTGVGLSAANRKDSPD